MKKCKFCAEEIQDDAVQCNYCEEMVEHDTENTTSQKTSKEFTASNLPNPSIFADGVATYPNPMATEKARLQFLVCLIGALLSIQFILSSFNSASRPHNLSPSSPRETYGDGKKTGIFDGRQVAETYLKSVRGSSNFITDAGIDEITNNYVKKLEESHPDKGIDYFRGYGEGIKDGAKARLSEEKGYDAGNYKSHLNASQFFLTSYFQKISDKKFSEAYLMRSRRTRKGYTLAQFQSSWASNCSVIVESSKVLQETNSLAVIRVAVTSTDRKPGVKQPVVSHQTGEFSLVFESGSWHFDGGTLSP